MPIAIQGLTKRFGPVFALDGIELEVPDRAFVALLGPSGSGKTTLLRIIAGLERADAGQILVDGTDIAAVRPRQRRIGFVFQHYALFRHMTVFGNIAFGLQVRPGATRPARSEIARRVEELLALVHLPGLGGRYPRQLSGGQRQRVALARALAIEPKLLLLDEPFGALDAKVRKELRVWLRELHDRSGLTSLFVTHDQEEALELADQVVVMRDGRIEQQGDPAALVDHPATAFVSSFLGDVNRLPCTVSGQGAVEIAGLRLPADTRGLAGGSRAIADIRPRAIRLVPPGTAGDGVVAGTARRVLHSATTVTIEAETTLSPDPIRIEADRYAADLPTLAVGDAVALRLPPPFVFAAET